MTRANVIGILIAALGGAAVGLERQWSGHAEGPRARFAEIRTFTMLGAVGGFSGWLWTAGITTPAAILRAGAVAIIAAAYARGEPTGHRWDNRGCWSRRTRSGIARRYRIGGVRERRHRPSRTAARRGIEIHSLVRRIDDVGLRSGVQFAVMALVVLPLLPDGPFGPLGGVRPRPLWMLVLFSSGLSLARYVARRVVGPGRGYLAAGLVEGLISLTNVTFTFARMSRRERGLEDALAVGAVGANAMLFPRVRLGTAILNPAYSLRSV